MRDHRDDGEFGVGCVTAVFGSAVIVIWFIVMTRLVFAWF